MSAREDDTSSRPSQRAGAPRAYIVREILELFAVVVAIVVAASFLRIPVWILVGVPVAKALTSIVLYFVFTRRALRRPVRVGPPDLIGRTGTALTPLHPVGQIQVDGEIWSAQSDEGEEITADTLVQVTAVRGNRLVVRIAS